MVKRNKKILKANALRIESRFWGSPDYLTV